MTMLEFMSYGNTFVIPLFVFVYSIAAGVKFVQAWKEV